MADEPSSAQPELLDEAEVLQLLGIKRARLSMLIQRGDLTVVQQGRKRRFKAAQIEYLIRR